MTGFGPPAIGDVASLGSIASGLRSAGGLEQLRKAAIAAWRQRDSAFDVAPTPSGDGSILARAEGLGGDVFDVWEAHYEFFGKPSMAAVVRDARIAFDTLAFDGIPGLGVRLLDHGVTGGLLLYHMTTLYFALLYALGDDTPGNGNDERAWRAFRTGSAGGDYDAVFWWSGIVWATFATAMHNLQQMGAKRWPGVAHDAQLLKLDDDPLAYLGILVDTIEDWDRYLVRRDTHFAGSLPLQGVDVGFAVEDGKIVLILPARRAQRIREELAGSLDGWTSIIEIRASED